MMPKNQESEQVLGFSNAIMTCVRESEREMIQPERTLQSITMVDVVTNP